LKPFNINGDSLMMENSPLGSAWRFLKVIHFPQYESTELVQILLSLRKKKLQRIIMEEKKKQESDIEEKFDSEVGIFDDETKKLHNDDDQDEYRKFVVIVVESMKTLTRRLIDYPPILEKLEKYYFNSNVKNPFQKSKHVELSSNVIESNAQQQKYQLLTENKKNVSNEFHEKMKGLTKFFGLISAHESTTLSALHMSNFMSTNATDGKPPLTTFPSSTFKMFNNHEKNPPSGSINRKDCQPSLFFCSSSGISDSEGWSRDLSIMEKSILLACFICCHNRKAASYKRHHKMKNDDQPDIADVEAIIPILKESVLPGIDGNCNSYETEWMLTLDPLPVFTQLMFRNFLSISNGSSTFSKSNNSSYHYRQSTLFSLNHLKFHCNLTREQVEYIAATLKFPLDRFLIAI